MTRRIRAALTLLLVLLAAPAWAELGSCARVAGVSEYVTLRERADRKGKDMGHIPLGEIVVCLGEDGEEFTPVAWKGQPGFVLTQYLDPMREKAGEAVEMTESLRISLNLFLTEFTRFGFARGSGYVQENPATEPVVSFCRDWASQDKALVPIGPGEAARRFFGMELEIQSAEEAASVTGGFASVSSCREIVPGLLRVSFAELGRGQRWEAEGVCSLSLERALASYGQELKLGIAYIRTGGQEDRSAWVLNRWVVKEGE